jgi:predicted GTPase
MDEIQIRKILFKSEKLLTIIDDDLAKKVLEIDQNATSFNNRSLLYRLVRSVDQYISKKQNVIYIGFVGHFSSGKSSTINNLLFLSNTSDERQTDLNPTDSAITLITDKSNSNSLLLMNRESAVVPVRTAFIDSELLKTMVIADTPGSGDPHIVNEMIQDFLPICDYIIYFISAANPIDQADIPLLSQKHQKLPFIPLHFVVTRTDEFRLDPNSSLSNSNINVTKKDSFTGQLISRLKEFADTGEIQPDNFTFIDNLHNYQIVQLAEKLQSWAKDLDKTQILKNHGYKIEFYQKNLEEIEAYFVNVIREKIRISGDFLKTARENILRFDKSVEVNKLKSTLDNELNQTANLIEQPFPNDILQVEDLIQGRDNLHHFIEGQSNGYIGWASAEMITVLKNNLLSVKDNTLRSVQTSDFLTDDISSLIISKISFTDLNETIDVDFSKMNDPLNRYSDKLHEFLNSTKSTKETIQKLRIGQQLDQLDDNFSEQFKMETKEEAVVEVYYPREPKINTYRASAQGFYNSADNLKRDIESIALLKDRSRDNFQKEDFKVFELMDDVIQSVEREVNQFYQEKRLAVIEWASQDSQTCNVEVVSNCWSDCCSNLFVTLEVRHNSAK